MDDETLTIKGLKGDKGDLIVDGVVTIRGRDGIDGDKGDKGDKGDQGDKGDPGKDGRNGIDGNDGINGKDGADGKDGSSDTPKEIVDKINTLSETINASVIKDLPKISDFIKVLKDPKKKVLSSTDIDMRDMRWHGGGLSKVSHDDTLTGNGTPSDPLSVVGGADTDKVKVNSSDTTAGFLTSKLASGTGISFTILNPGGNEQILIDSTSTATPGGNPGDVQFNDSGTFGGDDGLFWDNTNKYLGIGTTTPLYPIDVEATPGSSAYGRISIGVISAESETGILISNTGSSGRDYSILSTSDGSGVGGGKFIIGDVTSSVTRIGIDSTGNVGIGTPSPTLQNGSAHNFVEISSDLNPGLAFTNTSTGQQYFLYNEAGGSNYFSIFDATNGVDRLVITNTGNVGIATNTPSEVLDVNGNINITDGNYIISNNNVFIPGTGSSAQIGMQFVIGATGITTGYENALQILQSDLFGSGDTVFQALAAPSGYGIFESANNLGFYLSTLPAGGGGDIVLAPNRTEAMRVVKSTGFVGIGTNNPPYNLSVFGSLPAAGIVVDIQNVDSSANSNSSVSLGNDIQANGAGFALFSSNSAGAPITPSSMFIYSGLGDMLLYVSLANDMVFSTNALERMRINSSGNIGIGTASPSRQFTIDNASNIYQSFNQSGTELMVIGTEPGVRPFIAFDSTLGQYVISSGMSGEITFNEAYTFPTADGSSGQVLTTNGAGTLSFADTSLPTTVASGNQTGQTGSSTLATKTTPTAGTYQISGYVDVTAFTLGTVALQVSFNDSTGASKTLTIPITSLAGVVAASIGATGDFAGLATTIQTDGSASIVVKVTATAFTGTYDAYGVVIRVV